MDAQKSARPTKRTRVKTEPARPAAIKTVFLSPSADLPLTRDQIRVLNVLRGNAHVDSEEASGILSSRISVDLNTVAVFIADSPVIIHITSAVLGLIAAEEGEAKYRSIFETGTGRGCTDKEIRRNWEKKCFAGLYDIADDNFRPKYGALNFLRKSSGVKSASRYGECFLELDRKVNKRCTLAPCDTSCCDVRKMGVIDYCNHLLANFNKSEIDGIAECIAFGKTSHEYVGTYREVQIHGEVLISRDVIAVHYPADADETKVAEFASRFGIRTVRF